MSDLNNTKFLLGIEDSNLIFDGEPCNKTYVACNTSRQSNIAVKELSFRTTTQSVFCPCCGSEITKVHDYRTTIIKHSTGENQPIVLKIKKKRFHCDDCNKNVTEDLDFVKKHCFISNTSKLSVMSYFTRTLSMKEISNIHNISVSSTNRVLSNIPLVKSAHTLPAVLSFDEFRANTNYGKYAFMVVDPINSEIIDILGDRRITTLLNYFKQFSREERENVRFIISDLWRPYRTIARLLFPNAIYVADKFHYQRLVSNAFNAVRKEAYKRLDKTLARRVKRYWKLLNKKRSTINSDDYEYVHWMKTFANGHKIIEELLSYDEQLKDAYYAYQEFLEAIEKTSGELATLDFMAWLEKYSNSDILDIKDACKSLKRWKDEVINSFFKYNDKTLSNGFIEGVNNRIKVIKRVSFGYRSFLNFKRRILLVISSSYWS